MLVPGGPDAAFVVVRLRNADEAPFGLVQRLLVGVFVIGDANELAVGGEAPTMVRAGEYGRVALVVAADLHSAVPTGVEEYLDAVFAVAAEDHRFLAHGRNEVIAGLGYLALVTNEEPGLGEYLFLFLPVDVFIDEYLSADVAGINVDYLAECAWLGFCGHEFRSPSGRNRSRHYTATRHLATLGNLLLQFEKIPSRLIGTGQMRAGSRHDPLARC